MKLSAALSEVVSGLKLRPPAQPVITSMEQDPPDPNPGNLVNWCC